MEILNGKLDITPDNLYLMVEKLIDIDAESHFLTRDELSVIRNDRYRSEIMFYGDRIGWIYAQPLNLISSKVGVGLEPFKDENADHIMRRLANGISFNVTRNKPIEFLYPFSW